MATYPTAVKTFTTKADGAGNKIQAEHVNSLQDEITAIEDGILNGTAPINSSRITAPSAQITNCTISSLTVTTLNLSGGSLGNISGNNLSISSGSTLVTLNVTGGSTLASLNVTTATDAARVTNSAAIQIPNGAATALTFDTQRWATSGMHSTTTNSSRVTVLSTGLYDVTAQVELSSGVLGQRDLRIVLNDATVIGRQSVFSSSPVVLTAATTYRMSATTDYVGVQIYFDGSTGRVLQGAAYSPELMLTKRR